MIEATPHVTVASVIPDRALRERRSRCSRSRDLGVHDRDPGVHDAAISAFTMLRSRCSRSREIRTSRSQVRTWGSYVAPGRAFMRLIRPREDTARGASLTLLHC